MLAFETLPRFERDGKNLASQQQALFRKGVLEAFVPDLAAAGRPFRPGLRVKGMVAHPGVFELTWGNDGRATVSYPKNACPASRTSSGGGSERTPSSPRPARKQDGRRIFRPLYDHAAPNHYPGPWFLPGPAAGPRPGPAPGWPGSVLGDAWSRWRRRPGW